MKSEKNSKEKKQGEKKEAKKAGREGRKGRKNTEEEKEGVGQEKHFLWNISMLFFSLTLLCDHFYEKHNDM